MQNTRRTVIILKGLQIAQSKGSKKYADLETKRNSSYTSNWEKKKLTSREKMKMLVGEQTV
jgi:hypothetical protein